MNNVKTRDLLRRVADDAQRCGAALDGQPINGATLGEHLTHIYTAIYTLARLLGSHLADADAFDQESGR